MASRIVVKGASGSGKSTLASALAAALGSPYVELDALHHGPDWSEPTLEEFRRRVSEATSGERWVVDGNYDPKLGDLLLERADLVVWLDLPLRTILGRLVRRTAGRRQTDVELWAGNRETWRTVAFGRDALLGWAIRDHRRFRRELPARCAQLDIALLRLRSPAQVETWLKDLRRGGGLRPAPPQDVRA